MSMKPSQWTITCSAADCQPERWRTLSRPLVVDAATRADAVRQARLRGWVPTDLLIAGGGGTETWWCPTHVERTRESVAGVADETRRRQLLGWYARADKLRAKAAS